MATNSKTGLTVLAVVLTIVLIFSYVFSNTQAQTITTFTPADKFNIPELNGAISFALNGSCSAATLENGTWTFKDLRLNASQSSGNLKVSAQNSNITINFYGVGNFLSRRSAFLGYTVKGQGKQTFNLGLNSSQPTSASEWTVIVPDSVFLVEGEGWNLLPDDTVVVTAATSNVTIIHYRFNFPNDSNLPFYQQHSIAIITAIMLAATVATSIIIKVKMRK